MISKYSGFVIKRDNFLDFSVSFGMGSFVCSVMLTAAMDNG